MSTLVSSVSALAPLHINATYPAPDTVRVAVVGEVDIATAPTLRETLLNVLDRRAPAVVDINLAGVTFLDCAGVGALVAVTNAAALTGARIRVTHARAVVRQVLSLTGLLGAIIQATDEGSY